MGELLLLLMAVHTNELYMANNLYFAKTANIEGVHIKIDTSKEKVINFHIKDGKIIHIKACAEGIFYTDLDDPSMVINPTNNPLTHTITYPP